LKRGHNIKYRPYAFTEHGAIMAATVLNSSKAVEMSVFVVRAFVKMREQLMATATLAKGLPKSKAAADPRFRPETSIRIRPLPGSRATPKGRLRTRQDEDRLRCPRGRQDTRRTRSKEP
jgi:hypothetical protein